MTASYALEKISGDALGIKGSLSFANAEAALPDLYRTLADMPVSCVDLSQLEHVDSAGLACLLALLARADEQGRHITLENAPENLVALAQVSDLTTLLGLKPQ